MATITLKSAIRDIVIVIMTMEIAILARIFDRLIFDRHMYATDSQTCLRDIFDRQIKPNRQAYPTER
jgi:hypothetical protein